MAAAACNSSFLRVPYIWHLLIMYTYVYKYIYIITIIDLFITNMSGDFITVHKTVWCVEITYYFNTD